MKTINVKTGSPYDVLLKSGILKEAGVYISKVLKSRKTVIVTDNNVEKLYGDILRNSLKEAGIDAKTFVFPHGEQSKNIHTLSKLYDFLSENNITRSDFLIAVGGGVVGDLTGFAAASFLRGIDFVQIPTTLLAQVDSSVGGKTGIDIPSGKNLVGAFWQPRLVLCDPSTLKTLSSEIFSDGMAEVIKYGAAFSKDLFGQINSNPIEDILEDVIAKCIDIKRQVVEADEKESGERMKLNFGHTLGHSIEKIFNYSTYSHGQGVAIGMAIITKLSEEQGLTKQGCYQKIVSILKKFNLPYAIDVSKKDILENSLNDKKRNKSGITLVLIDDIGLSTLKHFDIKEYTNFVTGEKN